MAKFLVLTGARTGKRMIIRADTIEEVLECGVDTGIVSGDTWENLTPIQHTEIKTKQARMQVLDSFDSIYEAMSS